MGQILRAGEGAHVRINGMEITYLARSASTHDAMGIYGVTLAARSPGAGLHRHAALTETFEVHAGTLAMRIDGRDVDLGPGDFVLIPPGQPHAFANRSQAPVRFTLSFTPALEREGFFEGLAKLAAENRLADEVAMERLMRRYDQEPLEGFDGWSEAG
ncbi:cupin domain-containing protein [Methylobacterium durans]|uniref:cupin domain-containing protein n=1 Tax=Methylobacterium durans TaxID=2202825 RepID=UPI002AFFA7D0|nr:cupin domain-containing protein [Methylobacterium durans]MEA1831858.1 cupin domain-containing protein [Methylobacterium durans]